MSLAFATLVALAGAAAADPPADDDVVIVMDDDDGFGEVATSTGAEVLVFDDDGFGAVGTASSAPSFELGGPGFSVRARASARIDTRVAVDLAFDRTNEQIGELLIDAGLELEVDLTRELRVYAAPRLSWLGGIDREGDDREVLLTRAPEAFLGWASGAWSARAGYLVFDWGQSEIIGPSDVLNPPDLRRAPSGLGDQVKIPVPGAEVVASWGPLTLRGVVVPVFVPGRFFLAGWDMSALQGGLLPGGPGLSDEGVLEPAFVDQNGDLLLQTDRPRDRPDNATLGFRAALALDEVDLAATVVHGWNPFPSVTVDPSLVALGTAWAEAKARGETLSFDDPALAGALVDLQTAVESGAPIFKGKYERRTVFGLDAAWALDPVILKVDAAYSTRQVSYTPAGRARRTPTFTGVVGAEYYRGETLQLWVELFVQHMLQVAGTDPIAYVEPNQAPRTPDRSITWGGAAAFARYQLLDGDLAFELGALVTSRLDVAVLPRATYVLGDHHALYLGAAIVEGRTDGIGGAYSHLDQLFVGYRGSY